MQVKTKKIVIIGSIAGAIALVAGFFIVRGNRRAKDIKKALQLGNPNVDNIGNSTSGSTSGSTTGGLIEYPLRLGYGYTGRDAERSYVMVVQLYLNKKIKENNVFGLSALVVDGRFGPKTESALLKIAGVKQVTYTLYTQMQTYLIPYYLSPATEPYSGL